MLNTINHKLTTKHYKLNTKNGFVAFSTVVIVSFVVLGIALATTMVSIGEARSSFAFFNGEGGLNNVEACVDDTFLKIEVDNTGLTYAGGTITLPQGNCTNTMVSKVVNTWTMQTATDSANYKKKIQTVFDRMPPLLVTLSDQSDSYVGTLVNGCVSTIKANALADKTYTVSSMSGTGGTCAVTISKNSTVWTVLVVGTYTDLTYAGARQVIFDRQPPYIVLSSWKAI
jgi:hypothetical protein